MTDASDAEKQIRKEKEKAKRDSKQQQTKNEVGADHPKFPREDVK